MIAATLHGPNYWSANNDETDIEVFTTLEDVIEALFERYSSNGQRHCAAHYLDGRQEDALYPTFGEGMTFTAYMMGDNYRSPVLREETVTEILTAVHGGLWDYRVTLVNSEQGILIAQVERAGI